MGTHIFHLLNIYILSVKYLLSIIFMYRIPKTEKIYNP